jgi:hypothetical protein
MIRLPPKRTRREIIHGLKLIRTVIWAHKNCFMLLAGNRVVQSVIGLVSCQTPIFNITPWPQVELLVLVLEMA